MVSYAINTSHKRSFLFVYTSIFIDDNPLLMRNTLLWGKRFNLTKDIAIHVVLREHFLKIFGKFCAVVFGINQH